MELTSEEWKALEESTKNMEEIENQFVDLSWRKLEVEELEIVIKDKARNAFKYHQELLKKVFDKYGLVHIDVEKKVITKVE